MKRVFSSSVIIPLALASALALGLPIARADVDSDVGVIAYDDSSDALILSFREVFGELAEQDPTPLIQVFGDGRLVARFPDGTPRAGEYELRLEAAELESLLQSLMAKGLATFDSRAVHSQKQAEQSRRRTEALAKGEAPTFSVVADDSVSVFELNLVSYRPPGPPGLTQAQIQRKILWQGLATDAAKFQTIEAIQQLYAAELELRSLLRREGLTLVEGGLDDPR